MTESGWLGWPPEHAEEFLRCFVAGEPQPGGSKRAGIVTTKSKKDPSKRAIVWMRNPRYEGGSMPKTFVTDMSGAPGKRWRKVIRQIVASELGLDPEAGMAKGDAWDYPLALAVRFHLHRTAKTDFGTGKNARKLKDSARAYPSVAPDLTKLMRAFEDALNPDAGKIFGGFWRDDSRVVRQIIFEDYVSGEDPEGVEFVLYRMPETVGDLRALGQEQIATPPPGELPKIPPHAPEEEDPFAFMDE